MYVHVLRTVHGVLLMVCENAMNHMAWRSAEILCSFCENYGYEKASIMALNDQIDSWFISLLGRHF